ncbi:hypothetical protein JJP80_24665, partial [Enterobacter hormaechei]|nr:hypothetical protein [Enterobacter hormaechei]
EKEVVAVEALVARARSEVDRITKEINPFLAVIKRHEESLAANKSNCGVLATSDDSILSAFSRCSWYLATDVADACAWLISLRACSTK